MDLADWEMVDFLPPVVASSYEPDEGYEDRKSLMTRAATLTYRQYRCRRQPELTVTKMPSGKRVKVDTGRLLSWERSFAATSKDFRLRAQDLRRVLVKLRSQPIPEGVRAEDFDPGARVWRPMRVAEDNEGLGHVGSVFSRAALVERRFILG